MTPPTMAGWNLALRFGLELAALAGLAAVGWTWASGPMQWVAAIAIPSTAIVVWGLFNVPGDPSRSGEAPVTVPGAIRLGLELAILLGGAVALLIAGSRLAGAAVITLLVVHYVASASRVDWLVHQT